LVALCVESKTGWPRKRPDALILLKSVALTLTPNQAYTEQSINAALQTWLAAIGPALQLDHVTLRRYLVDEGFLSRASNGSAYHLRTGYQRWVTFEPTIDVVDVYAVVREAEAELAQKKQAHQTR
jgi:hypothetical protein